MAGYGFEASKSCGLLKRDGTIGRIETQLLVCICPLGTWEPGSGWIGGLVEQPHRGSQQPHRN